MVLPFANRYKAGEELARVLVARGYGGPDVLVLGLPRGGVPVAYGVARALQAPLDVFVVRKLGVPGHAELAMGAIASGGVRVLNESVVRELGIPNGALAEVTAREEAEVGRREDVYREGRPRLDVTGKQAILVDDGLATGATMRAAARALRALDPAAVVAAAPVGSVEACGEIASEVDAAVCAATPEPFFGVGAWYREFAPTSDREVVDLLRRAATEYPAARPITSNHA